MNVMHQCPPDNPLMLAWQAYIRTEDFENSKKWASNPEHILGSSWAIFAAGFMAGFNSGQTLTEKNKKTKYTVEYRACRSYRSDFKWQVLRTQIMDTGAVISHCVALCDTQERAEQSAAAAKIADEKLNDC